VCGGGVCVAGRAATELARAAKAASFKAGIAGIAESKDWMKAEGIGVEKVQVICLEKINRVNSSARFMLFPIAEHSPQIGCHIEAHECRNDAHREEESNLKQLSNYL